MILCLVIDLGGGPNHDRLGFRYWKDPGAFNAHLVEGATGRFLGWWSCMVSAGFVYMGTEVVGVAFGEADKPWKVIPRAIRQTFWRILFLYVGAVFLLGLVVPYNSPNLMTATHSKTGAGMLTLLPFGIFGLLSIFYSSYNRRVSLYCGG